MRNIIFVSVLVSGLAMTLPAMASEHAVNVASNTHAQQFLSKRSYAQPLVASKAAAEQAWVGASLMVGQDNALKQHQAMKLHLIGKRAY